MTWKDYEIEISEYFKRQFPNANISHNVKVEGRYSKIQRQIDILIEDYVAGCRMRIVIDGKFFSENIDVKDVEMFIGMLNDCEANKGLLITQEGYSQAAIKRAFFDPIDIELDILNFKELYDFQGFEGVIHRDKEGVAFPAPFGWIIDATQYEGVLATLYQRGLTLIEAQTKKEWIYANIWIKGEKINSLDDLLKQQEQDTLKHDSNSNINYLNTIRRTDYATKLRTIENAGYPTKEYTGFVEFDKAIFFCVMFTSEELKEKNIRKLETIIQNALPVELNYLTKKDDKKRL